MSRTKDESHHSRRFYNKLKSEQKMMPKVWYMGQGRLYARTVHKMNRRYAKRIVFAEIAEMHAAAAAEDLELQRYEYAMGIYDDPVDWNFSEMASEDYGCGDPDCSHCGSRYHEIAQFEDDYGHDYYCTGNSETCGCALCREYRLQD